MFDPNRLLPSELQRMHQREVRGNVSDHWTGHTRWPEHDTARRPRPVRQGRPRG